MELTAELRQAESRGGAWRGQRSQASSLGVGSGGHVAPGLSQLLRRGSDSRFIIAAWRSRPPPLTSNVG